MGLKEGTCCSRVRKVLFTVSLTVSHHSETCGMNTTLGVLRRASRKTCERHGRGSGPGSESESSRGWQLSRWVGAFYLSAGLLRRLRTDRVESRQIQAVDGQLLQVVQQGRGQVGAQSRARSAGQEEAWPVRCGLLKSRTDRTTRENMVRAEFQIFTINSVEVQKIVFCGSLLLVCPTQYRSIKKIFKEDHV